MNSRYCTYVIRNSRKNRYLGNRATWVKTMSFAKRFYDFEAAQLRASWFQDARAIHIEEAEKL